MALTSKTVGLIVAVVVLSLSGLVVLQSMLLDYALTLKEQAFHRNVMTALGQITARAATSEVFAEVVTISLTGDSADQVTATAFISRPEQCDTLWSGTRLRRLDFIREGNVDSHAIRLDNGDTSYNLETPQRVVMTLCDPTGAGDSILLDTVLLADQHGPSDASGDPSGHIIGVDTAGPGARQILVPRDSVRWRLVEGLVANLARAELEPIETRLDSVNLDSIIAATLQESGIDLEYAWGVVTGLDDSLRIARPVEYADQIRDSEYRAGLFPLDILSEPADLHLYFPDRGEYVWGQIIPLLVSSVVLMLIIIACFGFTIRTILSQRRFAKLMVDFINNMTHEFKTPISTVALATEAVKRPDVLEAKDRVLHFNEMIATENRRMRNQTDKILEMATLEDQDRELQLTDLDLHEVISGAVEAVTLNVENRKGSIKCDLGAGRYILRADKVHLTNIVHNILDNAIKYSLEAPQITVQTFDAGESVGFRVVDEGVGLRSEDRKRVFEKYFRVSSGNRHDVKGFGLGLAYVKLMVEAHGGNVALRSEHGKGTEVEVILPLGREGDER